MPSRYQAGIGGKLGPQAAAGNSGPYVGQPPSSVRNIQPKTVNPAATAKPQGLGRFFGGITRLGGAAQALNPNAPMLDRVIGSLTAGYPLTGMTVSTLQGAYEAGKNPYGGMASIVETDLSSAVQVEKSKADMNTIREKMIKDAGGLEQYKKLYPAAVEGGYTISPKVRKELTEERVKPTPTPTPTPVPETITPTAPVYNAKERVKKHGVKKAEDMAMMEWAKAHKGLAEKVKPGQAGYDAIQLALGKTTVKPEEIRGFMDDSGKSAEEARAILGGGSVETVIDGNKPMVTTINPAVAAGGSEVEIPTANFSGMSQAMQDLVAPSLEAGAAFNINVDNVLNQNDPQAFLMEQLKRIQGIKR